MRASQARRQVAKGRGSDLGAKKAPLVAGPRRNF